MFIGVPKGVSGGQGWGIHRGFYRKNWRWEGCPKGVLQEHIRDGEGVSIGVPTGASGGDPAGAGRRVFPTSRRREGGLHESPIREGQRTTRQGPQSTPGSGTPQPPTHSCGSSGSGSSCTCTTQHRSRSHLGQERSRQRHEPGRAEPSRARPSPVASTYQQHKCSPEGPWFGSGPFGSHRLSSGGLVAVPNPTARPVFIGLGWCCAQRTAGRCRSVPC